MMIIQLRSLEQALEFDGYNIVSHPIKYHIKNKS